MAPSTGVLSTTAVPDSMLTLHGTTIIDQGTDARNSVQKVHRRRWFAFLALLWFALGLLWFALVCCGASTASWWPRWHCNMHAAARFAVVHLASPLAFGGPAP